MKRKLLSLTLALVLLVSVLSMSSCGLPATLKMMGAEHSFGFSRTYASPTFSELKSSMDFVYEDTTLHLYGDGTWTIDMNDTFFIDPVIDKGTYTVADGIYTFEGFEYGFDSTGKMDGDTFEIYFADPTSTSVNAFVLYFKTAE